MTRRFRQSEIKAFKDCPREWWLKYGLGLVKRPVEEEEEPERKTADVGTDYHSYLEDYYLTGNTNWAEPDKAEKDAYLAWRMATGYIEWLAETGMDDGYEIVAVERQIEVPFGLIGGEDVVVHGKLDLEVVDPWGLPKIVDNKSVQTLDQADLLYLNFQGRTYSLLRRMEGNPIEGFIHNQARRVLRTASATPPFYSRVEVRYNDTLLNNHETQLRRTLFEMVNTLQKIPYGNHHQWVAPNPSRDCSWKCDFKSVCPMMDDGSDWEGWLEEFYVKADSLVTEGKEEDAND